MEVLDAICEAIITCSGTSVVCAAASAGLCAVLVLFLAAVVCSEAELARNCKQICPREGSKRIPPLRRCSGRSAPPPAVISTWRARPKLVLKSTGSQLVHRIPH